MGKSIARTKRTGVVLSMAGVATIGLLGLSACDTSSSTSDTVKNILTFGESGDLKTFNDNNSAELQKRGFNDVRFIYRNGDNSSAYDASLGSCRLTLLLDGPTRQWSVSQAGHIVVNPTAPLLRGDPAFAACFDQVKAPTPSPAKPTA